MPIISLEATESSSVSSTRPAIIHKTEYEYFRIIGQAAAALRTRSRDYPELIRKNRVYFFNATGSCEDSETIRGTRDPPLESNRRETSSLADEPKYAVPGLDRKGKRGFTRPDLYSLLAGQRI